MVSGGYIEQVELDIHPKCDDGTLPADSILYRWNNIAKDWTRATGKTFFVANEVKRQIAQAGFVDVVEQVFRLPLGPWGSDERLKTIGRFHQQFWREGMEGWVMAIATRYLGVRSYFSNVVLLSNADKGLLPLQWSMEQVRSFLRETRKAIEIPSQHVYYEV
jgi:hypothetical protein